MTPTAIAILTVMHAGNVLGTLQLKSMADCDAISRAFPTETYETKCALRPPYPASTPMLPVPPDNSPDLFR